MNIKKLEKILNENNQPKFRLKQITKAIYQDGVSSFAEISTIPKELRIILEKASDAHGGHRMSAGGILSFKAEKILISSGRNSIKALLKLFDGQKTETVLISPRPGFWSVCVSCQVGCAMNCAFCATGKAGYKRNLTAEEISDQVLFWQQYLRKNTFGTDRIANIVYMGMGEPFLNWKEVKKSLMVLTQKDCFNFGSRSISISTVGIKNGIEKILKDFPQINLAISLHFAENNLRQKYMPAGKNFNLEDLKKDLEKYFSVCKRKVFLEYILFAGVNDKVKNACGLVTYIKSFKNNYLLHVNLISYNSTHGNQFKGVGQKQIVEFRNYLLKNNINCTIRKSLGQDIQGACGQLAAE